MESIYVVFIVVFFILVIVTLVAVVIYLFLQLRQAQAQAQGKNENLIKDYEGKIREITVKHQHDTEKARQQSVATSRYTIKGQIAEQLAPLLPGFSYLPSDSHFIGDPIDYIVFNGYTDFRDKHILNDSFEVVILDIKHNTASLTEGQKAIGRAIEKGKVRFEVVRILEDGTINKSSWDSSKKSETAVQADIDPLENIPQGYRNMYLFLQKYPKAYEPWDEADDKLLKEKYSIGMSVPEIALVLKRNSGRVQARIKEKKLKRDNASKF
jgi:predicted Holliday junction resolvase-like endonuclease